MTDVCFFHSVPLKMNGNEFKKKKPNAEILLMLLISELTNFNYFLSGDVSFVKSLQMEMVRHGLKQ